MKAHPPRKQSTRHTTRPVSTAVRDAAHKFIADYGEQELVDSSHLSRGALMRAIAGLPVTPGTATLLATAVGLTCHF